jgi:hypothetical protein
MYRIGSIFGILHEQMSQEISKYMIRSKKSEDEFAVMRDNEAIFGQEIEVFS